jgi:two-component system LytT family response regulator
MLAALSNKAGQAYADRLLVKDGPREILLPVEHIDWIEAAEYYCCLHVGGQSYMIRETVTDLESRLDPQKFLRIHRSTIVRIDQIKEVFREGQGEGAVVLRTGLALKISRSGRQRIHARFLFE